MFAEESRPVKDFGNFPLSCESLRHDFVTKGVAVIPHFLSPFMLSKILSQTEAYIDGAYHSRLIGNAYLSDLDKDLPLDHTYNLTEETALATIACDEIPRDHALKQIYFDDDLTSMVAAIVGEQKLYHYACPMGAINISVMRDQDYLRWHFDQCDFVVSIPLQDPESGGLFQYVQDIRSPLNPNYEAVKQILQGNYPHIFELKVDCGGLIVFRGRNTLHRVTTIHGNKPRLVALLAYATTPDCDSSPQLKMMRYGRVAAKAF